MNRGKLAVWIAKGYYCVTVDGQTAEDQTVTVRERDSMEQTRVNIDQVKSYLREKLDM